MANPFYIDPTAGRQKGSLAGLGQVLGEARKMKEQKAEQERVQEMARKAFDSRDPEAMRELAITNPQMSALVYEQLGIEDATQKKDASDFMRSILTASPEQRDQLYQDRIAELQSQGRDASESIQSYQDFMADPEAEVKEMEFTFAGADPEGYKAFQSVYGPDYKAQELNLKKETLAVRREESKARRLEQQLKREDNELKKDALRLKIEESKQKIADSKREVDEGVSQARSSVDTSISTVNRLLEHPGLESAVGFSSAIPTIPGTEKADFEAELEAFDAQNFLTAIKQMKGMGALSDAEGKKVSASVGAINPKMSEKAFRKSLETIRTTFENARAKLGVSEMESLDKQDTNLDDLVNRYAD